MKHNVLRHHMLCAVSILAFLASITTSITASAQESTKPAVVTCANLLTEETEENLSEQINTVIDETQNRFDEMFNCYDLDLIYLIGDNYISQYRKNKERIEYIRTKFYNLNEPTQSDLKYVQDYCNDTIYSMKALKSAIEDYPNDYCDEKVKEIESTYDYYFGNLDPVILRMIDVWRTKEEYINMLLQCKQIMPTMENVSANQFKDWKSVVDSISPNDNQIAEWLTKYDSIVADFLSTPEGQLEYEIQTSCFTIEDLHSVLRTAIDRYRQLIDLNATTYSQQDLTLLDKLFDKLDRSFKRSQLYLNKMCILIEDYKEGKEFDHKQYQYDFQEALSSAYDGMDDLEALKVAFDLGGDTYRYCWRELNDNNRNFFFYNYALYYFNGTNVSLCYVVDPYIRNYVMPDKITYRGTVYPMEYLTYDFRLAKNLESITIPECVKDISSEAFAGLQKLQRVDLPKSLKRLGSKAFNGCTSLRNVSLPNFVEQIGSCVFTGTAIDHPLIIGGHLVYVPASTVEYTIPSDVLVVSGGAMYGCKLLKELTITETVERIEGQAFYGCEALISDITIPNPQIIPERLFYGCRSLRKVTIAEGVKQIEESAFEGCSSLTEINIPASPSLTIKDKAFKDCASLNAMEFKDQSEYLYIGSAGFKGCTSLSHVDFDEHLKYLDLNSEAFEGCTSLKNIVLWGNKEISHQCFKDCKALSYVSLPTDLTEIGYESFAGCTNLREIVLPATCETVCSGAFKGCENLTNVFSLNSVPPEVGVVYYVVMTLIAENVMITETYETSDHDFFDDETYGSATLYVPAESVNLYSQALGWSDFAQIVNIGSESLTDILEESETVYTVYSMMGVRLVDKGDRNALQHLPHGLYIVNGKKVSL